ncbi:MAG TPA: MBL fold metallo-hydrolase [Casimicrobiaceae bacterium]|nr:MBL fold metallo-hydrolase [Casimicrobiaceae bacterium]
MNATLRLLVLAAALAAGDAAFAQGAPRNEDGTFRNNYPHAETSLADFLTWQSHRAAMAEPPGGWKIPAVTTDAAALRAPSANPSITWIGHATVLLRLASKNILIDPIFSERASPVPFAGPKRIVPLPIDIAALPAIDVVMISHNHYDHLDVETVRQLAAAPTGSPRFLVPLGLKAWFSDLGIDRVEEFDWWQTAREGDLAMTFVPVQHWSRRNLVDRNRTLWGGWAVEGEDLRVIHLGDTGYSRDFRDIGERLGSFDFALIPIGAYAPRWFMEAKHLDPAEAIQVRADLRARHAIGIHWGTFIIADDPPDEAPQALAREREARGLTRDDFDVMAIGETRRLK